MGASAVAMPPFTKCGDLWSPCSEAPNASAKFGRRTDKKIRPFQLKKKNTAGVNLKMNQRAVFWWGERGCARAGVRAELQPFCSK